jgi:hypothetical protein
VNLIDQHLESVETALLRGYSLTRVADWIVENTFLKAEHYSFEDHEFQETIARDMQVEVVVRKCSQIGLSELSVRIALAFCNTMPGFTTIYTLPTASFARKFAKTRIDPVIMTSPKLSERVHKEMNSGEVKQFIDSFLYISGTVGANAAISVPADALVHDELDFSDDEVVSNYESRLTHTKYQLKRKFSTPTVSGSGISQEFETSKKHWNFVHCNHCNERFLPDYYKHVKVPGYDEDLKKITAETLWKIRWREAYLACPGCGKEPDMGPAHREWVVENTDYTGDKHGYQIQPFDAPKIITPAQLVRKSTKYERTADFINFNLGLPAEDLETSFSKDELNVLFQMREQALRFEPYAAVMGIDVGLTCHIMVGGLGPNGLMDILHAERCSHTELEKRKFELSVQFKVRTTVMDSQPYFDLLLRLQARDRNLWGAVYSQSKNLDLLRAVDQEKDAETGKERRHQVDLNRNRALDAVMMYARGGGLAFRDATLKDVIIDHMQDMKRVKGFNAEDELLFTWKKSARGQDHFHHTLLYTFIAGRLIGTAQSIIVLPFGVTSFKVQGADDARGKPGERPL